MLTVIVILNLVVVVLGVNFFSDDFAQDMDHQTPEEREVRLKKADSIRRMLADQSGTTSGGVGGGDLETGAEASSLESAEAERSEEKKHRERLLALNQVIAQQVLEKSRMVAGE